MLQNTNYPDPIQLEKWAREMFPFTDIDEFKLNDENYIVCISEQDTLEITYYFEPTYINVKVEPDEWKMIQDENEYDISHKKVYENSIVTEQGEDFFCMSMHDFDENGDDIRFDAYWILEETRIKRIE